ncbi:MAG: hypothetical protein LQ340_002471 [Diploschistes diacapsis]|nr:MAG: hypothetical protein LQ340_002471 [Diploschistes diacapsis]
MASSGVNVLRWSTLVLGIFYGVYHQSALTSQQKAHQTQRKFDKEESMIAQAKAEWLKKTRPQAVGKDGNVVTDPNDPKFDLEAYLTMSAVDEAKH